MAKILIIEDDISFSQLLESFLIKNKHKVSICTSVKEGCKQIKQQAPELILLDYRLPDGNGMEILEWLHENAMHIPAIIMTSFNDIRTAVKTVKMGAHDYITKPVNPDELLMIVNAALTKKTTKRSEEEKNLVDGNTPAAHQVHQYIELVASTELSVIIQGESGTGKEQVARAIHRLSKRAHNPFVTIDCGTLSPELASSEMFGHVKGAFTGALLDKKGQLEIANGGTFFLDEVGNLSYEVQMKLLRALQEKEIQPVGSNAVKKVDVRILAATNDDLISSVKNGKFREDLYHRLNEFKIQLLPLRERGEDFDLYITHFIQTANAEFNKNITGLSDEVKTLFEKYDWPGNLRELKNILKRAVLLSKDNTIKLEALPEEMALAVNTNAIISATDLKHIHSETEKELIEKTLRDVKYNKSKAAKLLNIDRTTLYYKLAKYGIDQ